MNRNPFLPPEIQNVWDPPIQVPEEELTLQPSWSQLQAEILAQQLAASEQRQYEQDKAGGMHPRLLFAMYPAQFLNDSDQRQDNSNE